MKRILILFSLLFFGLAQATSAQNVTVSLPDTTVTLGATSLSLPLSVQNFNNIGAVSIKINYDPSVLTYQGIASTAHPNITANANAITGVIAIGWFSSDGQTPLNISDGGKLLDLVFDYSSGTSQLNFIQAQSEINDISGTSLPVTYNDGQVTSNVKISLAHLKASPGDTIKMPMTALNLVNVGSISIKILYNDAVIEFLGIENDAVGFQSVNASGGTLALGWFSNNNIPFNLVDGKMADLVFKYIDNSTNVDFFLFGSETEITDINNNPLAVNYVNGSVAKDRRVSLPDVRGNSGSEVVFPLGVKNMSIGSASFEITYDPAVLTFVELRNNVGEGASANVISSGRLRLGFFDSSPNFSTGNLFDIVFTYAGGTSDLTFDQANSEFTDEVGGVYIGFDYFDGSISPNIAPVFDPVADQTVAEGDLLTFNVSATDADDTDLTYSASGLPAGADFTGQTFTWTPDYDQAGPYTVAFTVTDPIGATDDLIVNITVTNTNRPPVFTAEMPNSTVAEGDTLTFTYAATDPDGDPLTFSLVNPPANASIDANTGVFTFTPDYDQEGSYDIVVQVTDGDLTTTSTTSVVVVTNTNRPPFFTAEMPNSTVAEGDTLTFTYAATDPDGDPLTFSLVNPPANASIDANTGVFTFTPDYDQEGSYDIVVQVTDGDLTTTSTTSVVVVTNTNRPPVFTAEMPDTTVAEGDTLTFTYAATDPDGDALTFSLVNPLPNASIDANTGVFTFTPDYDQEGSYDIVVQVTDGDLTTTSTTSVVVVTNTNRAPFFTAELNDTTIAEGQLLEFTYQAEDPDGDPLTYALIEKPDGADIDPATGVLTWTPGYDQEGTHNIAATVTDGEFIDTSRTSIVVVTHTNQAPQFTAELNDTTINEGQTLTFTYEVVDPDGDTTLVFSLLEAPAGAEIDSLTGVFTWTPTYDQAGQHNLIVMVSDGTDADTSRTTVITVIHVNRPPVFVNFLKTVTINEGEAFTHTYEANDPDGDSVTMALVSKPVGSNFDVNTGIFTWTPTFEQSGIYKLVLTITDGEFTVKDSTLITVKNVNRPPEFTVTMPDTTITGGVDTLIFAYQATDPDGQTIKYLLVSPPQGAKIDQNTGVFTWAPPVTGVDYSVNIIAIASDGTDAVRDTTVVNVIRMVNVETEPGIPTTYELKQNFPNPFNPSTTIKFDIPQESNVVLKVYNMLGEEVATLVNDMLPAGFYRFNFDASGLASGTYIYRITAENYVSTKKMLLVK